MRGASPIRSSARRRSRSSPAPTRRRSSARSEAMPADRGGNAATRRRRPSSNWQTSAPAPIGKAPRSTEVSLAVGRGEIVGVAGVEGNGQRTLVRALSDLADLQSGRIVLAGVDVTRHAAPRPPGERPPRHPVRAEQRGPQPVERALGELVGAQAPLRQPAPPDQPDAAAQGVRRRRSTPGTCATRPPPSRPVRFPAAMPRS